MQVLNHLSSTLDNLLLAVERKHFNRVVDVDPARFVDFAIVVAHVARFVAKQIEINELVIAYSPAFLLPEVPVLYLVYSRDDFGIDACFFSDFPDGCVFGGFALIYNPLWQLPATFIADRNERDFDSFVLFAKGYTARGDLQFGRDLAQAI